MWKEAKPVPQPSGSKFLQHGPVVLQYDPPQDGKETWLSCQLYFGRHTSDSEEDCLKHWPTLAISEARAALDDLERYLEQQSCTPPASTTDQGN